MRQGIFRICFLLFVSVLPLAQVSALLQWGSADSKILVGNSQNSATSASVIWETTALFPVTGQIQEINPPNILGTPLYFAQGTLTVGNSDLVLTGILEPSFSYSLVLNGNSSLYCKTTGDVPLKVWVSGVNNTISGYPQFMNPNAIQLRGSTDQLSLGLKIPLTQNIVMSGGTINLLHDLTLANNIQLTGSGTINGNGNNLFTGQQTSLWTSTVSLSNVNMQLNSSTQITTTIHFSGANTLYGDDNVVYFGPNGHFILEHGASLLLNNVTLSGLYGNAKWGSIVCLDNTGTISFGNVTWIQDANYSFTQGQFYIAGYLDLQGTATFNYATTKTSTIASFGTLEIGKNFTFNYAPSSNNRNLLAMADGNATINLNGGTLASTTTGIRLTIGTLMCPELGYLYNQGAVAQSEGITFGNGYYTDDLNVYIEGTLQLLAGRLIYNNVEVSVGYAWLVLNDGSVYYRRGITLLNPTGTSWVLVSTTPAMGIIATGYNGVTWAAELSTGNLYQRTGTSLGSPMGTGWTRDPLGFVCESYLVFEPLLSVGVNGTLWAIDTDGNTRFRNNSSWTEVSVPAGMNNHSTSVGPNGYLFELTDDGSYYNIIYRTGISASLLMGSGWSSGKRVTFDAHQIAAGPFNGSSYPLWMISADDYYIDFLPSFGGSFVPLTPNNIQASRISVAADGGVWAVSYSDNATVYFRTGVTKGNPQGTNWQTVSSTGLPGSYTVTSIAAGATQPFAITTVANT